MGGRKQRQRQRHWRLGVWPKRRVAVVAVIAASAALGAAQHLGCIGAGYGDDVARYHNRTVKVVRVVDGDTLDVAIPDGDEATTRVRLWGVDTPEVHNRKRPDFYGPQASQFAKDAAADKEITLVLSRKRTRGKYGRLLAYVYLPSRDKTLNELLIETGHAYADRRFPHPKRVRYQTLEDRARKAKRGLWASVRPDQMPSWRQRMLGSARTSKPATRRGVLR